MRAIIQRLTAPLANVPIKQKAKYLILFTSISVVVFISVSLFVYNYFHSKTRFCHNLEAVSQIAANNCQAAVAFRDESTATEVLLSLKVEPYIRRAQIILLDGDLFARYRRSGGYVPDLTFPDEPGLRFEEGSCLLSTAIVLEGERIGLLNIQADFIGMVTTDMKAYGVMVGAVMTGALLIAYLLAGLSHQIISQPIVKLARTAKVIAAHKDYSIRAVTAGNDEIGQLTVAFNDMLSIVENREAKLKHEIIERYHAERDLKRSEERFELAVAGSADGIWDWNIVTSEVYFSPRWKRMLGFGPDEMESSIDVWRSLVHRDDLDSTLTTIKRYLRKEIPTFELEYRMIHKEGRDVWILSRGAALWKDDGQAVRMVGSHTDITERRMEQEKLGELNRQLLKTSREAGMAEIATGVLHNVGNVLNSVNVSTTVVSDGIRHSRIAHLRETARNLEAHDDDLVKFLTEDSVGRQLPQFIIRLAGHLSDEQQKHLKELSSLHKNLAHIKDIISTQQHYAKVAGVVESLSITELVNDAIHLNRGRLEREGIRVTTAFEEIPEILVDKHKLLQILINLIRNAKHAMEDVGRERKELFLSITSTVDDMVAIEVKDLGVGIAAENLSRIFQHGFTTRKAGHGFGLHSGAIAAKELGGELRAVSPGLGKGAVFTLLIPKQTSAYRCEAEIGFGGTNHAIEEVGECYASAN